MNKAQLNSALCRMQAFEHLEYFAIGYTDLDSTALLQLQEALPRAFISVWSVDGKQSYDFPERTRVGEAEGYLRERRNTEALAALDQMTSSLDLRRPLLPINLHARLMKLAVMARRLAAEEEQDRSRRQAMAEAALQWADRVLSVLPSNAEACWYLDFHELWLVRLQCLYARAIGLALRTGPDPGGANLALDTAQEELDRFLLAVNPGWHADESAVVRSLRVRIPD